MARETNELDLSAIFGAVWEDLQIASINRDHPYHLFACANAHRNRPMNRTVVLRDANEGENWVRFHTDLRSEKARALQQFPEVALLFYNSETQVQLRFSGAAEIAHESDLARSVWEGVPVLSRLNYMVAQPPGTPLRVASTGLPFEFGLREPRKEETETGYNNFAVVTVFVTELDWLQVTELGQYRARFDLTQDVLAGIWMVP